MSDKEKPKNSKQSSNIWGGRFTGTPSDLMRKINASISFDKRLYNEDIDGSLAHVKMLAKQKIVTKDEEHFKDSSNSTPQTGRTVTRELICDKAASLSQRNFST